MKYNLLDLTQTILSSMDSDEVNSINDTVEAQQVATVIRTVYFDIITRANLPETFGLFTLDVAPTTYGPIAMTIRDGFSSVEWIKYNSETTESPDDQYKDIAYLSKEDFLTRMYSLSESADNVASTTRSGVKYFYTNDAAPSFYTTFDDRIITFDSYDSTLDAGLRVSKTLAYGKKTVPFSMVDNYVPDLDDEQFTLLLNEAKSLAWAELKQAQHVKAEISAKRGWTRLQRSKDSIPTETTLSRLPDYGRK